jgi:GTP-binding protein
MIIRKADFIKSATNVAGCPEPVYPEYAFIGRSNVGKSSLINMLTLRKGLARISSTPGKTQLMSHFLINEEWYLVDLPGYGYARRSKKARASWEIMIRNYLTQRTSLVMVFLLIDSRIPPQEMDLEFMQWMAEKEVPFILLFTKTDKISAKVLSQNLKEYKAELLERWDEAPSAILTSSRSQKGREEVLQLIEGLNSNFAAQGSGKFNQ